MAHRDLRREIEHANTAAIIREYYLGQGSRSRKRGFNPCSDPSSFDWDYTEDTSQVYQRPIAQVKPLFGRGFVAGIDRMEQNKKKKGIRSHEESNDDDGGSVENPSDEALMSDKYWKDFKEEFNVTYKGSGVPKPVRTWAESGLRKKVLKEVAKRNEAPTPIQMSLIPIGLCRCDYVCVSEGMVSGKIAAYVLPMLDYILRFRDCADFGPYAIVLAPTSEIVEQIGKEAEKFAPFLGIKVLSIVGSRQSIADIGFKLNEGCDVFIATPGCILTCLDNGYLDLFRCKYVVVDEVDCMIDMGIEHQVVRLLDAMNLGDSTSEDEDEEGFCRTTCMFSVTMSGAVERLARKYLRNPVNLTFVGSTHVKATEQVTQDVILMKESQKLCNLYNLLDKLCGKKGIVFVNSKMSMISLGNRLEAAGYHPPIVSDGEIQDNTIISLMRPGRNSYTVFIATDADGCKLDMHGVVHVINYDMPGDISTYVRRIERTAHWGQTRAFTTFLTLGDSNVFFDLRQLLIQTKNRVPTGLERHDAANFKQDCLSRAE